MSEWLDLMLEEIARKRAEQDEAALETERRQQDEQVTATPAARSGNAQGK